MHHVGTMEDTGRGLWPDGCGEGTWCHQCREEIREEALQWLRALNVLPSDRRQIVDLRFQTWHPQWLLAEA
jgi:hypothetical protein